MGERVSAWENSPAGLLLLIRDWHVGLSLPVPWERCWAGGNHNQFSRVRIPQPRLSFLRARFRADLERGYSLDDRRNPGNALPLAIQPPSYMVPAILIFSQGEDGPPGNGTEGFPGFPVSVIGFPTCPPWYPSGHLEGTWMGEIDQSHQLVQAFGSRPLAVLGPSACGSNLAILPTGPWYNHSIFLHRDTQATEAPLG